MKDHSKCSGVLKNFAALFMSLLITMFTAYTSEASNLKPIVVVRGEFDHIENTLDKLGWDYSLVDPSALAGDLSGVECLYINCGMDVQKEYVENVKQFVENGGYLYASDWASGYLEPWGLEFSQDGEGQIVSADILDAGLSTYVKASSGDITFDLSQWHRITNPASAEIVMTAKNVLYVSDDEIQSQNNAPLVVKLRPGKGSVLYTTFHDAVQENMESFIEYLAMDPQKENTTQALLKEYVISSDNLISSSANSLKASSETGVAVKGVSGYSGFYIFSITDTKLSTAKASVRAASAQAASSCTVDLYKPDGSLYKSQSTENGKVCFNVPASDNVNGNWVFKASKYEGYETNQMVVCVSAKGLKEEAQPSSGSGSGGCNAGWAAAMLLLAIPAIGRRK